MWQNVKAYTSYKIKETFKHECTHMQLRDNLTIIRRNPLTIVRNAKVRLGTKNPLISKLISVTDPFRVNSQLITGNLISG